MGERFVEFNVNPEWNSKEGVFPKSEWFSNLLFLQKIKLLKIYHLPLDRNNIGCPLSPPPLNTSRRRIRCLL